MVTCQPLFKCWSMKLILDLDFLDFWLKYNWLRYHLFWWLEVEGKERLGLILSSLLPGRVLQELGVDLVRGKLNVPIQNILWAKN